MIGSQVNLEKISQTKINQIAAVLESVGVKANLVGREGWSYSPETRYFRFDKFQITEDGGRIVNPHKQEPVRVRSKVKLPPAQARVLESILAGASQPRPRVGGDTSQPWTV